MKQIYIPKPGSVELRSLRIPTIKDRVVQKLWCIAVEPISEKTADRTSFGFRAYRSARDAQSYIHGRYRTGKRPWFVMKLDINK